MDLGLFSFCFLFYVCNFENCDKVICSLEIGKRDDGWCFQGLQSLLKVNSLYKGRFNYGYLAQRTYYLHNYVHICTWHCSHKLSIIDFLSKKFLNFNSANHTILIRIQNSINSVRVEEFLFQRKFDIQQDLDNLNTQYLHHVQISKLSDYSMSIFWDALLK